MSLFQYGDVYFDGFTSDLHRRQIDYIAPIEHWIDSTMSGYDDDYDRMMEKRHLREKNHSSDGFLDPTYHESPFDGDEDRV